MAREIRTLVSSKFHLVYGRGWRVRVRKLPEEGHDGYFCHGDVLHDGLDGGISL